MKAGYEYDCDFWFGFLRHIRAESSRKSSVENARRICLRTGFRQGLVHQVKDNKPIRTNSLFHTIMRDIHFWIPLLVLLAGLLLLREFH
jgi:hypothetical protein